MNVCYFKLRDAYDYYVVLLAGFRL